MRFIFLCSLYLSFLPSVAQQPATGILDQLASKLLRQYQTEAKKLIVLQSDKPIYRAGTSIWFRAYSVSSNAFFTTNTDHIIITELVNEKDSVLDRVLLNADSQQYHASLQIPEHTPEGFYHIRAWTKTILQEYPSDIFIQPLYITSAHTNTFIPDSIPAPKNPESIIQFFPEGNQLINGVACNVIYTATDQQGNPLEIEGIVRDNSQQQIISFRGRGIDRFSFEPFSKNRNYSVYIKNKEGVEQRYPLPPVSTGAYQLSLQKQTKDQLLFRVALGDSVYAQKAVSYLLGIAAGKICFASSGEGMYMVTVPTDSLPHGIADFYLFDGQQQIVSSRSVFIDQTSTLVNISTDRADYLSRQKVNVTVRITDLQGNPVKAVLAASVTDNSLGGWPLPLHVADYFLLQRTGTGHWPPDILLNAETRDCLLVARNKEAHFLNADPVIKTAVNFYWDGLELKGKITDKNHAALVNEHITLLPDQDNGALQTTTDNEGRFVFRNLIFYGKQRFFVLVPSQFNKKQQYEVSAEPDLFPRIHTAVFIQSRIKRELLSAATKFKKQQADSIAVSDARIELQKMVIESAADLKKEGIRKKGLAPMRITADRLDKLNLSTTADAVKMLPGVLMINGRLTLRGGLQSLSGSLSDIEPLLIVDGVPTNTASVVDYLNSIPPSQIEYIEVLSGSDAAFYGTRGGNGAIVVKTANQSREIKNQQAKDRPAIVASGFYKPQSFYEPPYYNDVVREAAFTDNRATLYWNGELYTDASGKTTFSFYTSDLKNNYSLTVQGISEKGEPVYKTIIIKKR